jgi:hypothetical protein
VNRDTERERERPFVFDTESNRDSKEMFISVDVMLFSLIAEVVLFPHFAE